MAFVFKTFYDSCKAKLPHQHVSDLSNLKIAWEYGKASEVKTLAGKVKAKLPANNATNDLHETLSTMKTGHPRPPRAFLPKPGAKSGGSSASLDIQGQSSTQNKQPARSPNPGVKRSTPARSKAGSGTTAPSSAGSNTDKSTRPTSPTAEALAGLKQKSAAEMDINAFNTMLEKARNEVKEQTDAIQIEVPDKDSSLHKSHQYVNDILREWKILLTQKEESDKILVEHSSWTLQIMEELMKTPEARNLPKLPEDLKAHHSISDEVKKSYAFAERLAMLMLSVKEQSKDSKPKAEPDDDDTPLKKAEKQRLKEVNEYLPSINQEIEKMLASFSKKVKKADSSVKQTSINLKLVAVEFERLKHHIKASEYQEKTLQAENSSLKQTVNELQVEADDLRLRLRKFAGAKLADDNPNVADLSDPNRPTKLAERYSELYDDQWTDAFYVLTETQALSEREAIDVLCQILKQAYTYSSAAAQTQVTGIKLALMYPVAMLDNISSQDKDMSMSTVHRKVVTDLRKQTADKTADNIKKDFFKEISKIKSPGEDSKQLDLKEEHCRVYVEACLILCFHMCVQSPPIYIDTDVPKPRTKFNQDIYKGYTKSGKYVDYVVWPLLQLEKGGNTLSKGVAQGCS